jgi:hypothetical protein
MNIYLAGASSEMDMCAEYMQTLRDLGHTITEDWVANIKRVGDANPLDATDMYRKKYARTDLEGVRHAFLFWLLVPEKPSNGCWVELGYALAMCQEIPHVMVVASGNYKKSIFTALCDFQFPSHDSALQWIRTMSEDTGSKRFLAG